VSEITPDPVLGKLTRFTPIAPSLDPADVLFRAGRASARTPRGWKMAVSGLALVIAALLGERLVNNPGANPGPQEAARALVAVPVPAPDQGPSPIPIGPGSAWRFGAFLHATDPDDVPTSPALAGLSPADPPLTPRSREID
jgi:hypothetical protein